MKFGHGHPVEVRVRDAGSGAELTVRDHGLGIEPRYQAVIFNRFERAVSAAQYGGLGLGLYIARRIARAHGGDLRVESQPGQGATFTLTLPWAAPAPAEAESA
jgi:signal transduction histidine kinase